MTRWGDRLMLEAAQHRLEQMPASVRKAQAELRQRSEQPLWRGHRYALMYQVMRLHSIGLDDAELGQLARVLMSTVDELVTEEPE